MDSARLQRLFQVFDPAPLEPSQQQLYVELDKVRGSTGLVDRLAKYIQYSNQTTCQLLSGHIGSGKSTELYRLGQKLEQENYCVIVCKIGQDVDVSDADFPDIAICILRQMIEQLKTKHDISIEEGYFQQRWNEFKSLLGSKISLDDVSLKFPFLEISKIIKQSPQTRKTIRNLLEPKTDNLVNIVNEIIDKAMSQLLPKGYKGFAMLVDEMDKLEVLEKDGSSVAKRVFLGRQPALTGFKCHLVYTIPISLAYSCHERQLASKYGFTEMPVVPMTMIADKSGKSVKAGYDRFRQIVKKRLDAAETTPEEIFGSPQSKALDTIIKYSGGQPRELMTIIRSCLLEGTPITKPIINKVAEKARQAYARQLRSEHYKVISQVKKNHRLSRTEETDRFYMELLGNRAILHYINGGQWYGVNPLVPTDDNQAQSH
jgi:hypothetical protein